MSSQHRTAPCTETSPLPATRLVFQAICYDPLTATVLSLAETKTIVNDMLQQNRNYLRPFKHVGV